MKYRAVLLLLSLGACSSEPREMTGSADIVGQALLNSGKPAVNAVVTIGGLDSRVLPAGQTDSLGRYQIHLDGVVGRHPCEFNVSAAGLPTFSLDTSVYISPVGLHPLQIIDIHQPATP